MKYETKYCPKCNVLSQVEQGQDKCSLCGSEIIDGKKYQEYLSRNQKRNAVLNSLNDATDEMNESLKEGTFNYKKFMTRMIWGDKVADTGWIEK